MTLAELCCVLNLDEYWTRDGELLEVRLLDVIRSNVIACGNGKTKTDAAWDLVVKIRNTDIQVRDYLHSIPPSLVPDERFYV